MIELVALAAFAAGFLACVLLRPVLWRAELPRERDSRGRYVRRQK